MIIEILTVSENKSSKWYMGSKYATEKNIIAVNTPLLIATFLSKEFKNSNTELNSFM